MLRSIHRASLAALLCVAATVAAQVPEPAPEAVVPVPAAVSTPAVAVQVPEPAPDAAAPDPAAVVTPAADRASLIAAWERTISRSASLQRTAPDRYTIQADEIGYRGPLSINTVLVREQPGVAGGVSHFGVVDFALDELPAARASSHAVMLWRSGFQQFYFDTARGWRAQDEFAQDMEAQFDPSGLGLLAAAGGSGLLFLLPLAIIALFVWLGVRNSRRANALIDDTREFNDQARQDLERNRAVQEEQMQILRQSVALSEDSNRLLREIAETLRTPR